MSVLDDFLKKYGALQPTTIPDIPATPLKPILPITPVTPATPIITNTLLRNDSIFNILDYGGSIQDTINAVESAGNGIMWIPKGIYSIDATPVITKPISIMGVSSNPTSGSIIKWCGPDGGTMIQARDFTNGTHSPLIGMNWQNLCFDGGWRAGIGLDFDMVQNGVFSNIRLTTIKGTALNMQPFRGSTSPSLVAQNCMWNTFTGLACNDVIRGVLMDGVVYGTYPNPGWNYTANCCHNTFTNLAIKTTGGTSQEDRYAIKIFKGDNNSFYGVWTNGYDPAFPLYSLVLQDGWASGNYFYGFQGNVRAKKDSSNMIIGYDRGNGQPEPVIDAGAYLSWSEMENSAGAQLAQLKGFRDPSDGQDYATKAWVLSQLKK